MEQPLNDKLNEETRLEENLPFWSQPLGKGLIFVGSFIILAIFFHFLTPIFSNLPWTIFLEYIHLFNAFLIRGDYFFGILAALGLAYLLAYHPAKLRKAMQVFSFLTIAFAFLFIVFQFLFSGLPTGFLEVFPESVDVLGRTIRGSYFFALLISIVLAALTHFYPEKLKAMARFIFSFWGFKVALSLVDVLIFRNLLRASDADNFTMWTVPLLFAFLTNFLPFFFAVALKTHQEGFEDKHESSRTKKVSLLQRKLFKTNVKEDNRMKNASRIFLSVTASLILATGWLITNQRWLQMNRSLNESLAHFEDFGPHYIQYDGLFWPIENPPLDELPSFAPLRDFWHLNEAHQPVYGRYPQFLIDFTLLVLPILLIFVTIVASYFTVSDKIANRWYQLLEDLTDRKKKKMRQALEELEAVKKQYEAADFEYAQSIAKRNSEMKKLQVLLGAPEENDSNDVAAFEKGCRETIRINAIRSMEGSYDAHLNNLHSWILSDLEVFKSRMATYHEEVAVQHTVLTIDLLELISAYNEKVEPLKQFDTAEKTEALMMRLKMMNKE